MELICNLSLISVQNQQLNVLYNYAVIKPSTQRKNAVIN